MALTTFTNGTVANADEINANFTFVNSRIKQIYTGSDIDRTTTGESSHELTAVASSQANYVEVSMTGTSEIDLTTSTGQTPPAIELKAQIKETGGAYADIVAYKPILFGRGSTIWEKTTSTYSVIHTLTAGQKANGYQIKILSNLVGYYTHFSAISFTNSQVIVRETD